MEAVLAQCWRERSLGASVSSESARALVGTMRDLRGVADVQRRCCSVIRDLCLSHAVNKTVLGHCGAVDAVVAASSTHLCSADVQLAAASALRQLSAAHDGNKAAVVASGVLAVLVRVMDCHADNAAVQASVASLLLNLSSAYDEGKAAVVAAGAVPRLARAMHIHRADEDVQEKSLNALKNLAALPSNRTEIVSCDGLLAAVIDAVARTWALSVPVQKVACGMLQHLVSSVATAGGGQHAATLAPSAATAPVGDDRAGGRRWVSAGGDDDRTRDVEAAAHCRRAVVALGGVVALAGAVQLHAAVADVAAPATTALKHLLSDAATRRAISVDDARAVRAAVSASLAVSSDERVRENAGVIARLVLPLCATLQPPAPPSSSATAGPATAVVPAAPPTPPL